MKDRPILFSTPMVRAEGKGYKNQTRREMNPQPFRGSDTDADNFNEIWQRGQTSIKCPYGVVGDRLWVREAWRVPKSLDASSGKQIGELCLAAGYPQPWAPIQYEADKFRINDWNRFETLGPSVPGRYRHARFMPKWASRTILEINEIRIERLLDISDADAIAEGIERNWTGDLTTGSNGFGGEGWVPECGWINYMNGEDGPEAYTPRDSYFSLWEMLNGKESLLENPWVWVIKFKRVLS